MHLGTSQLLLGHLLIRHCFHNIWTGNEHERAILDHEGEVGEGRRVDGTTCARSHDQGDLGNDTGRVYVALEDLSIASKRLDTFLNSRTARIIHADHRCARKHSLIHDLANFLRLSLTETASENCEVLRVCKHCAPVNGALACHNTIAMYLVGLAVHSEVRAPVHHVLVIFLEGSHIK